MQSNRGSGGRPATTSWVHMSAGNPTLAGLGQQRGQDLVQQQEQQKSSLSSVTTSSRSNSLSNSTSSSAYGADMMMSAPSSFVGAPSSLQTIELQQQQHPNQQYQTGEQQQAADEEHQKEENRKLRLQLYVFVLRCISYSFNAKQTNTTDLHQRHQQLKLRKSQLDQIIRLHTRYIKSAGSFEPGRCQHQHLKLDQTQLKQLDELHERAHLTFNRKFLQNERMRLLVESECCSQQDLRELFRQNVEEILKESALFTQTGSGYNNNNIKRMSTKDFGESENNNTKSLLANRDVIINSWLIKFESIIREESDSMCSSSNSQNIEITAMGSLQPSSGTSVMSASAGAGATTSTITTTNVSTGNGNQQQQNFSKEQLYQMFQNILNIKKFEHQLLYNALQLDSSDEQAAAIRRELDGRITRIVELERNKKLMPKFVLKEMESLYLDEMRMSVNKLMVNLDSLPVMKVSGNESRGVYGLQKFRRYNNRAQASLTRESLVESHPSEPQLTKLDVVLTFNIEVIVMEVRGLRQLAPNREIYCTMEIEGSERLQTEHVQAKKPLWDTQGDFTTNHPLPVLKIKLYAVNPSMLSLEDKELGKLVLRPTVLSLKTPEWCIMTPGSSAVGSGASNPSGQQAHQMQQHSNDQEQTKIRVVVRMDRPQQLKHCGYLYGIGKSTWRKLKRRYHILIQVSQYTFVMCSYRDKKAKPTEMLQLDGYTVDYIEPPTDLIMEHCSEMTSSEHASSGSSTLGLAGRLANVILKQPTGGNTGAGSNSGDNIDAGQSGDGDQPSAIQTAAALSDELHSKYYFNVVKEGDSVVFACDDEQECFGWVMALYRATGQAHKPTPLRNQYSGSTSHYIDAAFAYNTSATQQTKLVGNVSSSLGLGSAGSSGMSSILNGVKGASGSCSKSSVDVADQRARKHGMDEFISADPCKFQHNQLFKYLQNETLGYRLNDHYCSLGWFSSGQVLVLDEYCARYGVRTCFRHLAYLNSLLDFNQRQHYFIDHTLLNYGYDFCASHVSGNSGQAHPIGSVNFDLRPDGVGTVTVEERDLFHSIKTKLLNMIERQISNFSYCFPFGKPDGALKATLSLLERVLLKEQQSMNSSMVQNEEVRQLIKKCLEQAALNNYTKLSGQANLIITNLTNEPPHILSSSYTQVENNNYSPLPPGDSMSPDVDGPIMQNQTNRLRTSSNLSITSSMGSYASSTISSSTTGGGQQSISSGTNNNDSLQRRTNHPNQSSKQQTEQAQQQCLTMAMIINNEQIKPKDKLRHLIRLAELCCEQVEDNNKYFSDSFAWHSDLMMDHFELFWSLFSVDMDKILNELGSLSQQQQQQQLQQQLAVTGLSSNSFAASLQGATRSIVSSSGANNSGEVLGATNREIFALFQVLNNHMRKSPNLECKKFKSYLCDTFKPKLLRYIDIMESALTRMLFKAYEKDGQVNCQIIDQMFVKLDDLQKFVLQQLRWPRDQLADQLHQRLKLMAYELCDACVQRTLQAFQHSERKSNKWTSSSATNYASPVDMIQMINLALETRNRSLKLCTFNNFDQMSYHSKIDKLVETALGEMQPGLMAKMLYALESTLTKLARYDEGNLLAPILSLTYKQGMSSSGRDIGKQYVTFVFNCCDSLRHKINDELWIVNLLEEWYAAQMNIICTWLGERIDHSLHDVQLVALTNIMPKIYADMSLQGVSEEKLNLKTHQTIVSRLKMEEAAALSGGCLFEQPSTSIFTTSILSSLASSSSTSNSTPSANSNPNPPSANMATGGQCTPLRQPIYQQQQQQQQQQKVDSPTIQSRRFQQVNNDSAASGQQDGQDNGDNIADRAFQSATRMFKGFWAS